MASRAARDVGASGTDPERRNVGAPPPIRLRETSEAAPALLKPIPTPVPALPPCHLATFATSVPPSHAQVGLPDTESADGATRASRHQWGFTSKITEQAAAAHAPRVRSQPTHLRLQPTHRRLQSAHAYGSSSRTYGCSPRTGGCSLRAHAVAARAYIRLQERSQLDRAKVTAVAPSAGSAEQDAIGRAESRAQATRHSPLATCHLLLTTDCLLLSACTPKTASSLCVSCWRYHGCRVAACARTVCRRCWTASTGASTARKRWRSACPCAPATVCAQAATVCAQDATLHC